LREKKMMDEKNTVKKVEMVIIEGSNGVLYLNVPVEKAEEIMKEQRYNYIWYMKLPDKDEIFLFNGELLDINTWKKIVNIYDIEVVDIIMQDEGNTKTAIISVRSGY